MAFLLHVGVVGFHHQLGNQVEFLYPPVPEPPDVEPRSDNDGQSNASTCSLRSDQQHDMASGGSNSNSNTLQVETRTQWGRKSSTGMSIDRVYVPELWQSLPFYALPDGVHGVDEDYVYVVHTLYMLSLSLSLTYTNQCNPSSPLHSYFTLPDLNNPSAVVYGIACYRQINLKVLEVCIGSL
jgi:hypothetical protein